MLPKVGLNRRASEGKEPALRPDETILSPRASRLTLSSRLKPAGSVVRRFLPVLIGCLLTACGGPSLTPAPPGVTLAITGVTVLPMDGQGALRDHTVLIEGDRIVEVTGERLELPDEVERVDGAGAYLIPGLWDMHVHALSDAREFLPLFLAHGVTGVRDMGGEAEELVAARNALAAGTLPGLRLVAAGPTLDGPGHRWSPSHHRHLETTEDARAAVADLADLGSDFAKVYSGLSAEVYDALVEAASEQGLPFVGHVPMAISAVSASDRGQASLEHLDPPVTFLPCVEGGGDRLLAALGAWTREGYGAWLRHLSDLRDDADDGCVEELHRTYRENGTRVVPTLVNHVKDSASVNWDALPLLDETRRQGCLGTLELFHEASDEERDRHHRALLADVARLHGAGVSLLAGSDVPNACLAPGASLHDELALLVEAGLTPWEALEAATSGATRFLGLADQFGTVAPGRMADLVLLGGDPTGDIRHTRDVIGVVLGGRYRAIDERTVEAVERNLPNESR